MIREPCTFVTNTMNSDQVIVPALDPYLVNGEFLAFSHKRFGFHADSGAQRMANSAALWLGYSAV